MFSGKIIFLNFSQSEKNNWPSCLLNIMNEIKKKKHIKYPLRQHFCKFSI